MILLLIANISDYRYHICTSSDSFPGPVFHLTNDPLQKFIMFVTESCSASREQVQGRMDQSAPSAVVLHVALRIHSHHSVSEKKTLEPLRRREGTLNSATVTGVLKPSTIKRLKITSLSHCQKPIEVITSKEHW